MSTDAFDYHHFLCEQRRRVRKRIGRAVGLIPIGKSLDILLSRVDMVRHAVRQSLLP